MAVWARVHMNMNNSDFSAFEWFCNKYDFIYISTSSIQRELFCIESLFNIPNVELGLITAFHSLLLQSPRISECLKDGSLIDRHLYRLRLWCDAKWQIKRVIICNAFKYFRGNTLLPQIYPEELISALNWGATEMKPSRTCKIQLHRILKAINFLNWFRFWKIFHPIFHFILFLFKNQIMKTNHVCRLT